MASKWWGAKWTPLMKLAQMQMKWGDLDGVVNEVVNRNVECRAVMLCYVMLCYVMLRFVR